MNYLKKFLVVMLISALILPVFSTINVKADSSFSLEDLSADEIVDLIFDSCSGIYPEEGQTTEEWSTILEKKIPFLDTDRVNEFKTSRWNYSYLYDFIGTSDLNKFNEFTTCFGQYPEAMDGSYHLSKEDQTVKYITISLSLDDYKKANDLYDKLVKRLNIYYNTGKDYKNIESNECKFTINSLETIYGLFEEWIDNEYKSVVLSLKKVNDEYRFFILFIHPDYLNNPTELAKSMLKSSDEKIELDDPEIKSLTNKKGKKLVVKYIGDNTYDNEIYKIQVSTSKKFKNIKEFETNKASATIRKLKKGKKYYVRVMYTVTEDGETVSSSWSKVKSITIKK